MTKFLWKRAVFSGISLILLVIMVFFLIRLTGDPASLFLPIDASQEAREQFREIHGLNDPLLVQFFRYVSDLIQLDFGTSLRRAEPALDSVLRGFEWTLYLALVTMFLVTLMAVVVGSLAPFGRVVSLIARSLFVDGGQRARFLIAIVAIVVFSVQLDGFQHLGQARFGIGFCRFRFCLSDPLG